MTVAEQLRKDAARITHLTKRIEDFVDKIEVMMRERDALEEKYKS